MVWRCFSVYQYICTHFLKKSVSSSDQTHDELKLFNSPSSIFYFGLKGDLSKNHDDETERNIYWKKKWREATTPSSFFSPCIYLDVCMRTIRATDFSRCMVILHFVYYYFCLSPPLFSFGVPVSANLKALPGFSQWVLFSFLLLLFFLLLRCFFEWYDAL